jgi:ubiquinone/menaquinone biosynthesis C-methylase UbiE
MFSDPAHNIEQLGLPERSHIADFGAGSGAYTIAAAKAVKNFGKVYAVEVQKELAMRIKALARTEGLENVEALWGDIERAGGTKLADASVDAVIISNVLFQAEDKKGVVEEAKRVLKSGGKALVVDWSESFGNMGPSASAVFAKDAARKLFEAAGFSILRDISAGAHHWGFIAQKKGNDAAFTNQ